MLGAPNISPNYFSIWASYKRQQVHLFSLVETCVMPNTKLSPKHAIGPLHRFLVVASERVESINRKKKRTCLLNKLVHIFFQSMPILFIGYSFQNI